MVGKISASHSLSKEVIEGVNERTGGVPLFVEEVTRLLLERGERGGVQAIPPTRARSPRDRGDCRPLSSALRPFLRPIRKVGKGSRAANPPA
jgi:hypothetical protein